MNNWFKYDIREFADRVIEWNSIARGGQHDFSAETIKLQQKLLTEEENELIEAYGKKNKEAFLKELCDCLVVGVYFTFLLNQTKFYGDPLVGTSIELEEYMSTLEVQEIGCSYEVALENVQQLISILRQLNVDTTNALNNVMDSNYSKFIRYDSDQERFYDKMCSDIVDGGRYKNVEWQQHGGWVVLLDGNGKIMKPATYREADVWKYVYG